MAGNSTISITYKLEGDNGGFKKLTVDAEGLRKVLGGTVNQAEKLKTSIINFAALSAGLDSISQSLNTLQAKFKELSDAYAVQETAERKLETVMRQRMGATDAEIDSIKKLASAQQEIGVIGDEVQLSGAQQVATFLKEKASLDVLLPAMNNLLAQQKGLNATTQDAVQVGNLMGKAMQGQTGALTRVGITFTAAQEQVMKFGTESERAAMLAQIITDNVGNMNQQLAQTDSGKQKQLENTLGDVKEKMGALVSGALPYVTIAANTMMALTATMKFSAGIRVATIAVTKFFASGKIMGTAMAMIGVRGKSLSFVIRALTHSLRGGAGAAVAMKVALRGLMISTGIGIAIAAITTAIEYLVGAADDAADSAENLAGSTKEAQKEFDDWKKSLTDLSGASEQAIAKEIGALDKLYKAAMDESKSRKERIAAAEKLKATYPDTFANLTTEAILAGKAAKAYDKLKTSIIEAATAKAAQSKIEQNQGSWLDLELERKTLTDRLNSNLARQDKLLPKLPSLQDAMEASSRSADNTIANQKTNNPSITTAADNKRKYAERRLLQDSIDKDRARLKEINARQSAIKNANSQLEQYASTNPVAGTPEKGPHYTQATTPTPEPVAPIGSLADIDNRISGLNAKIKYEVDPKSRAELYKEVQELEYSKHTIEFKYKHPEAPGKLSDLAEVPTLQIVPELDASKITPVIEDVSGALADLGKTAEDSAATAAEAFGQLGSSIAGLGNALQLPELNIAGTMAQAIATMVQGYAEATVGGAKMGPLGWIAFAATGLAQLTAMISAVKSAVGSYATGGIVGGNSKTGDKLLARVNSGEMILNATQQRNLFRMINAPRVYAVPRHQMEPGDINTKFIQSIAAQPVIIGGTLRAAGRELVCVLANETRIAGKSGRRTNIKI